MDESAKIERLKKILEVKSLEVTQLLKNEKYIEAKKVIENDVKPIIGETCSVLLDLSFIERKLNNFEKAYAYTLKALNISSNYEKPEVYDEMVELLFIMNRNEEVNYYAKLSIKQKKENVLKNKIDKIKFEKIPISDNRKENIISYSLFGNNPKYCETAIVNMDIANEIYKNWTCRFYIDETVPYEVVEKLKNKGAEIIYVNEKMRKLPGVFYRFLVLEDRNVKYFLMRDADSLLSYKEKAAVDEWIKSDKNFHIMRDAKTHSELILAGMWGG